MTRIEKLEAAVKAALKLRKSMHDFGAHVACLSVKRSEVAAFDLVLDTLKDPHATAAPIESAAGSEHLDLIKDCEQRESRLSDWDRSFVDSIKQQLENGRTLSVKQSDVLDGIWERVTAKG